MIFGIWGVLVVLLNNFHNERNECLNENLTTLRKVAPLFEEVNQFLTKVALTMVISEELEKLGRDSGRHLCNELLIKL